ncbi:MAG: serine--tRNA ligase [Candidatus Woesearchaeota archaeon]|jgi:seryl-tRNA synthetase|nr:serine--tRNA ligase [Candidatus Woesearchaeota archaeon]
MLDIKFIRENADLVKKDLEKRDDHEKVKWVDEVLQNDKRYRDLLQESQKLRHDRNIITQEINELRKQGGDISPKLKLAKALPGKIKKAEEDTLEIKEKLKYYLMRIPNILHKSVPFGTDDTGNKTVRTFGKKPKFDFKLKDHSTIIEDLGMANFDDAAKVSGNGFYYLMGDLALLDLALMRFAIDILVKDGYTLVEPPLMVRKKPYEGVTDLADFETMMYKIDGEDLYLIATSEHPIAAMNMNKTFDESELPLKYCGVSPCFRKEIGSHGIDTKGLFRVHQFNKIEQFVFCKPEDSWKLHEELIANAETIFQKLKLPYRVVNICTGDIGIVAAKKYDLEVYMPRENKYREVVSCSNCTGYQATRLNIKYRKGGEKEYMHTLNSTAIATGRALRAIIENYQQKDGSVKIPAVLVPYMNGIKKLSLSEQKKE